MNMAQPTVAGLAIVMTFLTAEIRFVKSLGAFRMAFACCQLPASRTMHALITTRSAARVATEITLGTDTAIAVVTALKMDYLW